MMTTLRVASSVRRGWPEEPARLTAWAVQRFRPVSEALKSCFPSYAVRPPQTSCCSHGAIRLLPLRANSPLIVVKAAAL
jgi:hypothetical protein